MREDDRTGVSEARPDRQYRMPPCPIHSQFRVVGHDFGGRTHRTCPLSDFEPRSTWLKGATWEIPVEAKRSELARLKGKIEKIEPAKKSDVIEKAGSGEENYLVGLKVEGSRIGILVDQSASMTDRRLIDIVRRKNSSEQDRKAGPKWQRTVRIVQWLLARLPARAEVAVVAFNGQTRQLGGPNWTSSRDAEGLGKIIADLGKLAPLGPTNLQAGLDTINRMRPSDLYVLTDGLPTKGTSSFRSLNPFTNCNALWGGSSTISGECRLKLFTHTLTAAAPSSGVKVNGILLPIEGDPGAAHAFWTWTSSTGGLLVSPADGWP